MHGKIEKDARVESKSKEGKALKRERGMPLKDHRGNENLGKGPTAGGKKGEQGPGDNQE